MSKAAAESGAGPGPEAAWTLERDIHRALADVSPGGDSRLQTILDAAAIGVVLVDMHERITEANPAMCRVLGYEREELLQKTIGDVSHPDDYAVEQLLLARLLRGEIDHFVCEKRFLRKDDTPLCVRLAATLVGSADGEPAVAIRIVEDLTDQRELHRRLEDRDRYYASLIQSAHDLLAVLELDGTARYVSPSVARLGWSADEVVGRRVFEFVHVDDRAEVEAALRIDRLEHEPEVRIVARLRDRSRGWRDFEIIASELAGDDAVRGIAISARDVTEQVAAQRHIAFQASLLDAVNQAVMATDLEGVILSWSRGAEELYGWPAADALGRNIVDIAPASSARDHALEIMASLRRGESWQGEFLVQRRDGTSFPALVIDSPIHGEDGELIGIVGVSSDLTERKALESQLHQAQKMEAIGQLAGGIAHDFNNMLTAILGYTDLCLLDLKDEAMRSDLGEVRRAAQRAMALTGQLLAFSRKQVLNPAPVDLRSVLAEMEGMIARLIGESIVVTLESTSEPAVVLADRGQIGQVLMNLAVNARDAIHGGGRLTIRLASIVRHGGHDAAGFPIQPGRYVSLCVTDTGCGIPAELLPAIFEPFFTTKEPGKGTGLGLSTVFGIVKQSGGHICVVTEVGVGTSFEVLLPRLDVRIDA